MKKIACFLFINTFLIASLSQLSAQTTDLLRQQILKILHDKRATVGVSVRGITFSDTVSINGSLHFPMQSVFKLHIALALLHDVDRGKFRLDQFVRITPNDLLPNTWSPIREKYPKGVSMPLSELIRFTVAWSDNNGCDILLRLVGGPTAVDDYVKSVGISSIAIVANEEQMHRDWDVQYQNWTTPIAATELLAKLYQKELLSDENFRFIWEVMVGTTTGINRIKGGIPNAVAVAHKTGSSGVNKKGVAAATNDIGIVTLSNGRVYAIAVFVSNSLESEEANEQIISDISKAVYLYAEAQH